MLLIFFRIIYLGHQKVAVMVFVLQALIAREVLSIGYMQASKRQIPLFRTINAWFLLSATYFIYGKRTLSHFYDKGYAMMRRAPLAFLLMHHTFVSFWLFLIGFMIFVLSLRPGCYRHQLNQFSRMLMLLLFVVAQANFIIFNIKEGLIWFVLPALMIIINDVTSYCVGFFFGRTRLTPLSPKKTWEGYIGGAVFTLIAGIVLARFLSRFEYMICPKPDFGDCDILRPDPPLRCATPTTFLPRSYAVPLWAQRLLRREVIFMQPMLIHGVVLAAFASIVGPFGGFFASGVKRAFRVKDFADLIPGHGGVTDRMDCQLLMGAFTFVYRLNAVSISAPDVGNLLAYVADLSFQEQLELHRALSAMLERRGLISSSGANALIQNSSASA
jgi:phosphatidate cytidylyltransferase